jgi:hypothetical protein
MDWRAAYESAVTGRRVELPFTPPKGSKPIELWLEAGTARSPSLMASEAIAKVCRSTLQSANKPLFPL